MLSSKLVTLGSLLGSVAWLGHAPGWEPALATFTSLAALVVLEVADSSSRKGPPQAHVDHDRNLFQRYETILSEARLLNELNGSLFDHRTQRSFAVRLDELLSLASRGEGQYLIPSVQRAFSKHPPKLAELSQFIGRHFFHLHVGAVDQDPRLALYPDHRRDFDNDRARFYHEHVDALLKLLEQVEGSLAENRDVIKRELAI